MVEGRKPDNMPPGGSDVGQCSTPAKGVEREREREGEREKEPRPMVEGGEPENWGQRCRLVLYARERGGARANGHGRG